MISNSVNCSISSLLILIWLLHLYIKTGWWTHRCALCFSEIPITWPLILSNDYAIIGIFCILPIQIRSTCIIGWLLAEALVGILNSCLVSVHYINIDRFRSGFISSILDIVILRLLRNSG